MSEQSLEYEYDDYCDDDCNIDLTKLRKLFKNNENVVVKRKVGQHGRNKKYQLLSDEEYNNIKKQQNKDASKRYYQRNQETQKAKIKKYNYDKTTGRDQKIKHAKEQIVILEKACEENRVRIDTIKQLLDQC